MKNYLPNLPRRQMLPALAVKALREHGLRLGSKLLIGFLVSLAPALAQTAGPTAQYSGAGRARRMVAISGLLSDADGCRARSERFNGRITQVTAGEESNLPALFTLALSDGTTRGIYFEAALAERLEAADQPFFSAFIVPGRSVSVQARQCEDNDYFAETVAETTITGGGGGPRPTPTPRPRPTPTPRPGPTPSNDPPPGGTGDPRTRAATIRAFVRYRQDREQTHNNPRLGLWSQLYTARLQDIQHLDVRGVDAGLVRFFALLSQEFRTNLVTTKQAEKEAQASAWINDLAADLTSEPDNELVALGMIWAQARMDSDSLVAWKARWWPLLAAATDAGEAEAERLLSDLQRRYNYPFYTTVYDFSEAASQEGRSNAPRPAEGNCWRGTTTLKVSRATTSNFIVCAGDRVSLLTGGFMQVGTFAGFTGPDGLDAPALQFFNVLGGHPHAALLVKFQPQSNAAWTPVNYGADLSAPVSGALELIVNDAEPANNRGSFSVQITVRAAP